MFASISRETRDHEKMDSDIWGVVDCLLRKVGENEHVQLSYKERDNTYTIEGQPHTVAIKLLAQQVSNLQIELKKKK